MNVLDWYRIFTWLCWGALAAIVAIWAGRVGARSTTRAMLAEQGLPLAALIASVATAGSLYLSEGAHLTPCRLCWFQRTMMYPLAVILIVAAIRRDRSVRPYALTLALVGLVISTFHYLVEWFPDLESAGGSCDPTNPCSVRPLPLAFGFISIPFMAGTAFLLVASILVLMPKARRDEPEPTPDAEVHS